MARSLEELLGARAKALDEVLVSVFKNDSAPSDTLIKRIAIHQALAAAPHRMDNPKSVRGNTAAIYDKYGPGLEILDKVEKKDLVCPISQCRIEVPWVSSCGHVFEERIVVDFIKKRSVCPVLGCKKPLQQAHGRSQARPSIE
ncbi:hypothetical protein PAPHI01_1730 [Pancytospora philotis]|nr:hypothetical protein PAPHI01_1730 [Pancytospora philotis]